ncbi:uncharacterized protein J4E92_010686 [Alternaria infectoria]|uniref:uncharacterized protein n=1 Tax=Alternaria infectoria TaxID=45303 RepID=UPI00221EC793|nr:uncharacterized protein J4E92_010686 [Alternaria infectoria]KAI4909078.1 hypothetical protein J4E92_010686 [Alternaria infectoria]
MAHDTVTGVKAPAKLEDRVHGERLARSMRDGEIGVIRLGLVFEGTSWSIHKTLMESECENLQWNEGLASEYFIGSEHSSEAVDLFVEWLYTQEYCERQGLAQDFAVPSLRTIILPDGKLKNRNLMDWAIKAAFACWELGASLRAKNFQNYAMKRLFEAFSRPLSQLLVPQLLQHTYFFCKRFPRASWQLQHLIQDIILRNWSDETVVNHRGDWYPIINSCQAFGDTFHKAKHQDVVKRREKKLSLADYLIH